jgi:membrane protein required for colicin V production
MLVDIIALILFVWGSFKGLRNGFVVGIFSFLAFIIGLAAAIKLSAVAAVYIGNSTNIGERWLPFIAFSIVFIIVVFLVRLGAKAIEGLLRVAMLGWLNKIGGIVLYVLLYFFIFSVLLFYAEQLHLIKKETLSSSVIYRYIQPLAPRIINALGYILPFFKNMFAELQDFFAGIAKSVE